MPSDLDFAEPLRDALLAAHFTYDRVAEAIGEEAHRALGRNETLPAQRRTTSGAPLDTLVRLFLLQTTVARDEADQALPGLVDRLCNAGLLEQSVSEVAARTDCRPYAADDQDLWVVSDLTPGLDGAPVAVGSDHVLGISSASTSLAQLTMREPVASALDLGTGCGVQALHLGAHAARVVATDVNTRALWMTRLNAALNEVPAEVDVRDGSFFEPVAGERFDLIATNPPFVISPATGERLVYRDSGLPGDRVVEHIVRTGPDHLADGGWLQVLANWSIVAGRSWDDRLGSWLRDDCDALVVQRETLDPSAYVELWLKDSGHHGGPDYARRYDTWLSWLEESGIEGVGFGWINVRLGGGGTHQLLEWPYDVEQPIGPAIHAWGDAVTDLRGLGDEELLATTLRAREDVQQETVGRPGAEDPEAIVLRQQRGFRRARTADTVEAAFLGACDGDLSVGQLLGALGALLERDVAELQETYLPVVRELVGEGFLTT
ncbi:Methyltransferase small domain-containing protein [Nocardioides exalbidus]|uniref:Methyltransferase small domain-containing protein n=1 Tax=Nocardioides exalbidus TaxID=402596 RepID=A0A1H4QN59_9ACTN|nr:class I SAM-dependent methyltransferase [Nocardioides exalbidus]SEC21059.1 Methyltransferase small domain-containing protein [Nocardioides exalbidus]